MIVTIIFLAVIAAIAAAYLAQHGGLMTKPWLEEGVPADIPGAAPDLPPAKIGLRVFLAVVGSLFALVVSAYSMRMQLPDWWSPPVPPVLWANTAIIAISSLFLQYAKGCAHRGDLDGVKRGIAAGGASAIAFLIGQAIAWRHLAAAGYFLASNPANSFFYLITAVHGLHVLGGLVALGRAADRAWRGRDMGKLRLSVDLCTTYWHFLLFVWVVLFALINGWASDFAALCRELLT